MLKNSTMSFIAALLATNCVFADTSSQEPPKPYDADLFSKDREALFINAELLVWTVLESGLEYGTKMKTPVSSAFEEVGPLGKREEVKFDWRPGFRISFGYFNAPKYWDVLAQYTWFSSHGNKHTSKPDNSLEYLQPADGLPVTNYNYVSKMSGHVEFTQNIFDGLVTRNFFPNNHLRLKLSGGLTAGWMNQDFKVNSTVVTTDSEIVNATNKYEWGYWGIGFRIGGQVDWFWGKDFYFTGKTTGAVLIGRYRNGTKEDLFNTTTEVASTVAHSNFADYRGVYNFQFMLGPSWQKSFSKTRYELFLGYEMNSWFNLAEVDRFTPEMATSLTPIRKSYSPITLSGVTLRLNAEF